MLPQPLGSIPVLVWICSLKDSFHTTSSPFMFRLSWSSACPGCPSGWTTSRPRPGWRSPSPRCSPCPPPPPPSTPLCLLCPTSRWKGDYMITYTDTRINFNIPTLIRDHSKLTWASHFASQWGGVVEGVALKLQRKMRRSSWFGMISIRY